MEAKRVFSARIEAARNKKIYDYKERPGATGALAKQGKSNITSGGKNPGPGSRPE
jgi:hypothetical protein